MSRVCTPGGKANYSTPGSKLVLRADAPREDWLKMREQGTGGSDMSKIILGNYGGRLAVYYDKTGHAEELDESEPLYWGKALEDDLRDRFTRDTGLKVRSAGLHRSKVDPFAQVTVDGLVGCGGIAESKTHGFRAAADDWVDGSVSDHAELQVQWGMFVTGRDHAHVFALIHGQGFEFKHAVIERDDELIEIMRAANYDLWQNYILKGVPPTITAPSELDVVKHRFRVADLNPREVRLEDVDDVLTRLEEAKAKTKAAQDAEDLVAAEARLLIGDATKLIDPTRTVGKKAEPLKLASLANDGTFSEKAFRAQFEDPAELDGVTKFVEVLDMDAVKTKYADQYRKARARVLRINAKRKA